MKSLVIDSTIERTPNKGIAVPYDHENSKGLDKLYRAKFAHLVSA
jgi:hypothetical protein